MNPINNGVFLNDPWWLVGAKVTILFVMLLVWTIFNVWFERRVVGKMQHRLGPIMNGPGGLFQAVADGAKLILKEDFMPHMVDKFMFTLAPIISGTAALTAWCVIPFGGEVEIFGVHTRLQLTDMPVAVLLILAIASVGIYGFVLAGWSSNSPYALYGSLRSSAQMISYEVSMGLALVTVFLYAGSMSTNKIVEAQGVTMTFFGHDIGLQQWYWLLLFPSFVVYVISMVGETNRAPFDLPECEQEIVSGHITEYSGFRYAAFFLAEYINMATVSAVATTLFLGGYHTPWPLNLIPLLNNPWFGPLWVILKVQFFIFVFVWLRGTLPRLKYNQFMDLGWKVMIPFSLVWIVAVATVRKLTMLGYLNSPIYQSLLMTSAIFITALLFLGGQRSEKPVADYEEGVYDPFAGGYPVPPMPGQVLPEMAGDNTAGLLAEESQATTAEANVATVAVGNDEKELN